MIDTQDSKPDVREDLERVGVTDLKTIVEIRWKGVMYRFVPKIEITISLKKDKKGVHMSRLIESIAETVEEETEATHNSLEELEKHILLRLKEKHPYEKADISMETDLVVEKKTPVSRKRTMETHNITVAVYSDNGLFRKKISAEVLGNTVCPHAMEHAKGKAHIQRTLGVVEVESDYSMPVELEEIISCVEKSFSSPVYTLLKTADEKKVVEQMFSNPKFVEDVCRSILANAKKKFKKCRIKAKAISYESIHRHNVIAEAYTET